MARKPLSQRPLPNRAKQGFGADSDGGGVSDRREAKDGTDPTNRADDMARGGRVKHRLPQKQEKRQPKEGKPLSVASPGLSAKIDIGGVPEQKTSSGSPSTTRWSDVFTKDPNLGARGKAELLKSIKGK
jgi:hypothetical protein